MNEIFRDELYCIAAQVKKCVGDLSAFNYDELLIIGDGSALASYLGASLLSLSAGKVCIVGGESLGIGGVICYGSRDAYLKEKHGKNRLIFFLAENDSENKKLSLAQWLEEAEKGGGDFVFAPVFGLSSPLPEGIVSIAENELSPLAKCEPEDSAVRLVTELEEICTKAALRGLNVKAVRLNNVFGPLVEDSLGIHRLVADIAENNAVELKKSDMAVTHTGCYIREAVVALCLVAARGKTDNVYNAASCEFTLWDIKSSLLKRYADSNPQVTFIDDEGEKGYKKLDTRKLECLGFKAEADLEEALYRIACAATGEEYKGRYLSDIYSGKLRKIQGLEMKILGEVDCICRENDIKYFPVGGTLLGAVRHGGFIPWDDDIDIGMLREDFEKFRKICPDLLPENMCYLSHGNDKNSQYPFDKIRLKGTYFSTTFSGQFEDMENGIFVDILVYDRTSNSALGQKLHIKLIRLLTFLVNVRWVGKDNHRGLKGIIVRMMKKLPIGFYHRLLDGALKMYSRKKNSRYLLDGVGQYLTAGAFPLEWYDELIDVKYEDMILKAPVGYDGYLRHWYGDSYMELLTLSRRASGHEVTRLDLGGYLYGDDAEGNKSLEGELYGE